MWTNSFSIRQLQLRILSDSKHSIAQGQLLCLGSMHIQTNINGRKRTSRNTSNSQSALQREVEILIGERKVSAVNIQLIGINQCFKGRKSLNRSEFSPITKSNRIFYSKPKKRASIKGQIALHRRASPNLRDRSTRFAILTRLEARRNINKALKNVRPGN